MNTLILIGLTAAVIFTIILGTFTRQPEPPQIIYIQAAPVEPEASGVGCLPLIILAVVILLAINFG